MEKQQTQEIEKKVDVVKRNSLIFILIRLDFLAMVIPVIVKIWEGAGMNFSQMLFLQGIFALTVVLVEIPSGAISDSFKRKYVLGAGYAFIAIASVIYGLGRSFAIFAISEAIYGIGLATISGSDTGLLYDTLSIYNRENEFKKILGKSSTLTFIVAMASLPISGVIALYSLRWPLFIIAIVSGVKALLSLNLIEVDRTKAENAGKATKDALNTLFRSKFLIGVLLAVTVYSVAQRVAFWAYQPKLFDNGLNSLHIGLIFAGMNLIAAVSSWIFSRIHEQHEDIWLLGFMLLELVSISVLWYFDSLIILSMMFAVQIARGGRSPIVGTMIQRKASSSLRATIVSIYSSIGNLLYFIVSLTFTLLSVSMSTSLLSMSVFSLAIILVYSILVWSNHNGKSTYIEPIPNFDLIKK